MLFAESQPSRRYGSFFFHQSVFFGVRKLIFEQFFVFPGMNASLFPQEIPQGAFPSTLLHLGQKIQPSEGFLGVVLVLSKHL